MFAAWVLTLFLVIPAISSAQNADPVRPKPVLRKIVIDAGHGGEDPGALGAFSSEKDISLSIALKLESMLRDEMPDVEVYMTRTTDVFDPVTRKAKLANAAKGDLFVCIHVNQGGGPVKHSEFIGYKTVTYYKGKGSKKKKYTKKVKDYRVWYTPNTAKGTETFIYGVDKSNAAKEALSENEDM